MFHYVLCPENWAPSLFPGSVSRKRFGQLRSVSRSVSYLRIGQLSSDSGLAVCLDDISMLNATLPLLVALVIVIGQAIGEQMTST